MWEDRGGVRMRGGASEALCGPNVNRMKVREEMEVGSKVLLPL